MIISNLRLVTDEITYEPNAIVDVKIPCMTLYEIHFLNEEIRNEILLAIGKELVEKINDMRKKEYKNERKS